MIYGMNSRSMDYRERRGYRRNDYESRSKRDSKVDVRKRHLPNLQAGNNALNLRVVYPHTIFVVGVSNELSSNEVGFHSFSIFWIF